MTNKKSPYNLNIPVVLAVTLLCALSLLLFFYSRSHADPVVPSPLGEGCREAEGCVPPSNSSDLSDIAYYTQQADEYIALLPADKRIVATLIDSVNHHLVYFETSSHPSCYCYDLESLTTQVLFGGENGFYCDTKLLIAGTIRSFRQSGDWVWFIADNRAPETDIPNAILVFALNLYTHQLHYFASGSDAAFNADGRLILQQATLLYHSLFTGENVYDFHNATYNL